MPWLNNIMSVFGGKKADIEAIKQKIQASSNTTTAEKPSNEELEAYVADIDSRVKKMVKDLKNIYKKYNIVFNGFRSFEMAIKYLHESIRNGSEEAYNNLIKLESVVTAEQKRHLALIRMAVTTNGKRVMEEINKDPEDKETFNKIFGEHNTAGTINTDGAYQQLWSEVHKLSEYILLQKNKVYH